MPRLRAGVIQAPAGHVRGRVRVIVTLDLPPLAAAFSARTLQGAAGQRRLDVGAASSQAYLRRVAAAQRAAAAELRRAIPQARVGRGFRILLDGLAVTLPVRALPRLVRLDVVRKVYPSLGYSPSTDRSPSLIEADVVQQTTGARGDGIKIGVVDDGVDQTNPFFNPAGFSFPDGFPRGETSFTTPKVIVAKSFPGPGSGDAGKLPVDRQESFHGTHVAGIAAGVAGTNAEPGPDHPRVAGLSGVAPRAWIGNYRVFNVPTPVGNQALTPEIVAAFEAAVADGMDVINFSGGGPESEPANDAMFETVRNTVAAGVVPVISAGNDRDEFGLGSTGTPGTTPDGISVAAATNTHVFAPTLAVTAPGAPSALSAIAIETRRQTPPGWAVADQPLVDVTSVVGREGRPVDPYLCGLGDLVNEPSSTDLVPGSLTGVIVLALRGRCTFVSKAERARAAGAAGLVLVNNRPGYATPIPVDLAIPGGMIADLDGAQLRAYLAAHGGRTSVRIGRDVRELETGRGAVVAFFSSAGPTSFGHRLKPDVAAPGSQILSSTLPETAGGGSPFAVFDGTSMAAPHVAGAVALLRQRHPEWTPEQVKSALMSTAGSAFGDTAQTNEAPVLLEGAGLVSLPGADRPLVFTEPASLSFGDLNVTNGARSRALFVRVTDADGGAGEWQVELRPQSASVGASVGLPGSIVVTPGGEAFVPVVARAAANAEPGDNYGFVILRRGDVTRKIPYLFLVTRPALASTQPQPLARFQLGSTVQGISRVARYRFPDAPFGAPPTYTGPPMNEGGAEQVYVARLDEPAANLGVAVELATENSRIDPFFLGSLDENDVQSYAGTPVNVNGLMFDFLADVGAAGAVFPLLKAYYVAVDSGDDPFTGRELPGEFALRSWVNDVAPPVASLITRRVAAGRPTIVARVVDAGAGVDPLSLVIGYSGILVGAAAYDAQSGIAVFPLPAAAPALKNSVGLRVSGSDFQETKNVNVAGDNLMPNTTFRTIRLTVVARPAVAWIFPQGRSCLRRSVSLLATASSTSAVRSVRFRDGARTIATVRRGVAGLYSTTWRTGLTKPGRHRLVAVVTDAKGRQASAVRNVRVCR